MLSKEELGALKCQNATCRVQAGLLEPITEYRLPNTPKWSHLGMEKPLASGKEAAMQQHGPILPEEETNEGKSLGVPSPRHWLCRSYKLSWRNGAIGAGWAGGAAASPAAQVRGLPMVAGCLWQARWDVLTCLPLLGLHQLRLSHSFTFLSQLLTELLSRSQHILVRAMSCPAVVIPHVVWHHHLPIHLLHRFLLLLLAARISSILADSAGHSDVVPPHRDGGHRRTRDFECWVA